MLSPASVMAETTRKSESGYVIVLAGLEERWKMTEAMRQVMMIYA